MTLDSLPKTSARVDGGCGVMVVGGGEGGVVVSPEKQHHSTIKNLA